VPQRAWSVASAWETSDAGAIGRPIIERLFYSSRGESARPRLGRPTCPYSRQVGAIGPVAHLGAPRNDRLERGPGS
jgi:hypothetical protein